MKRIFYSALIMISTIFLSACANRTTQSNDEMINPGDRIGNFLITTREDDDVVYITNLHCPVDGTMETCEIPIGTKINISQGFMPSQGNTSFEEAWLKQTCEMVIDGRPVNLQAFGYDEWKHPIAGIIRVWNVVIVADQPGTISAESKGVFDGELWNFTAQINFTEP